MAPQLSTTHTYTYTNMQIHGESRDDSDVLQLVADVKDRSEVGQVMGGWARERDVNQERNRGE